MAIAITGTGCYIPSEITPNEAFVTNNFLKGNGIPFDNTNEVIIQKFQAITGIDERRYAKKEFKASDLGFLAAEKAIENAGIDPESLDYIVFAHNFGDVAYGQAQGDMVPSLATRVKHLLKIKNPHCVAYDMLFGCPGWLEGVIQAHAYIKSGIAKKCLIIGAETLSRVVDPCDRDSMIYSDGAGACILEETDQHGEVLSHISATYSNDEAYYLFNGKSHDTAAKDNRQYIKMYGRKIYEFALSHVPQAMKKCVEMSGVDVVEIKKIFIHQANEKMDEAIIKRFYSLFDMESPEDVMPMNIHKMGNSSVATIPTLFDTVRRGKLKGHQVSKGDVVIFASVGAGMNINAVVYRC